MFDWTNFDTVFRSKPDCTLDHKQTDAVIQHRKELGGILYFDRIWNTHKVYPPKSNAELRSLWQKVVRTEVSDEKKQAVLFYILRDCRQPGNVETLFAQKVHLPPKYLILVTGLWELDHLQFSRALESLSDPSLTHEFADEVLLTLLAADQCDNSLATAYYLTVQPPLAKQETLRKYFDLLVDTSVAEAYHFCSKKGAYMHKELFEQLLHSLLEEKPCARKADRLITLLSIPYTEEEEHWLEDYLSHGQGAKLLGAKDSIMIRRLVTARPITTTGSLDRHRGQRLNDINWDDIRAFTMSSIS